MYIEARFGGLEVTLGDEHGDILSADMTGMTFSIMVYIIWHMNILETRLKVTRFGCQIIYILVMVNSSNFTCTDEM